ncbi:elongation factor P, partial [Candidatus Gottesmanbacteria bacterium]|nr:elongation factor P [Candidatus Gottesmanbacteria bacterium]
TFISGAKVEEAVLEKKEAQYLYQIRNRPGGTRFEIRNFVFMDPKTFEQFELLREKVGDQRIYLQEGMTVKIIFYEDEPLAIELPIKMEFTVAETEPGFRGNSATNIFKDAILENGLKIRVPLFVKVGDRVLVDTRTGEYVERV